MVSAPKFDTKKWKIVEITMVLQPCQDKELEHNTCPLPLLDIERMASDLLALLSLLFASTAHTVPDWFQNDLRETEAGWMLRRLRTELCNKNAFTAGPKYGKLTAWNASEAHRGEIIGYPRF